MDYGWLWLVGVVAFLIVEGVTYQFICIWFALGCIAGMISSMAGADVMMQFTIFIAVSLAALLITRPFVRKLIKNKPHEKTNADRFEGRTGVVIETVENTSAKGQVKVDGAVWSARSGDDAVIGEGEQVVIKGIEGVKLLVERKD